MFNNVQVILAIVARPNRLSIWRPIWNVFHKWNGRTALAVGIGNTYLGFLISAPGILYYWGFSAALAASVAVVIAKVPFYILDHRFELLDGHSYGSCCRSGILQQAWSSDGY